MGFSCSLLFAVVSYELIIRPIQNGHQWQLIRTHRQFFLSRRRSAAICVRGKMDLISSQDRLEALI